METTAHACGLHDDTLLPGWSVTSWRPQACAVVSMTQQRDHSSASSTFSVILWFLLATRRALVHDGPPGTTVMDQQRGSTRNVLNV
ncbi:unnamed protein product [Merluccius merluccius]